MIVSAINTASEAAAKYSYSCVAPCGRLMPKFVPVAEAEAAIARAGGAGPAPTTASAAAPQPARETQVCPFFLYFGTCPASSQRHCIL